jgi:hypothetical protein
MLEKTYIRDGKNQIVGSVTSGYHEGDVSVVRDNHNNLLGRTSERFNNTRDGQGGVVSINSSDPGLLINQKK